MRQELKQIPLNQHSPLNYVDLGSIGCRGRPWWLLLSDQIKKRCTDCLGCALTLRNVPKCECSFMDNVGDLENHITTEPVVRQYLCVDYINQHSRDKYYYRHQEESH